MEFSFKSKFNLEDVVWFMCDNQASQGIIHTITYMREESVDTRCRHKSIFTKIKSYLSGARRKVNVRYELDRIREDGEFRSTPHFLGEDEIFSSKEELLKSL